MTPDQRIADLERELAEALQQRDVARRQFGVVDEARRLALADLAAVRLENERQAEEVRRVAQLEEDREYDLRKLDAFRERDTTQLDSIALIAKQRDEVEASRDAAEASRDAALAEVARLTGRLTELIDINGTNRWVAGQELDIIMQLRSDLAASRAELAAVTERAERAEAARPYPGSGHPWADFLNARARVLAMWAADGNSPEYSTLQMAMDPTQVRLILATVADHPEEYGVAPDYRAAADIETPKGEATWASCTNQPCPVCGDGPSGEWSEGSEVDCDGCGTALYVETISPCLGTTTFTLADAKCPACAGRGFIGNAADAPDCTACKGEGRRELTLEEAKAAAGIETPKGEAP